VAKPGTQTALPLALSSRTLAANQALRHFDTKAASKSQRAKEPRALAGHALVPSWPNIAKHLGEWLRVRVRGNNWMAEAGCCKPQSPPSSTTSLAVLQSQDGMCSSFLAPTTSQDHCHERVLHRNVPMSPESRQVCFLQLLFRRPDSTGICNADLRSLSLHT
ncbi:hypothetical protein EG329_001711, partial [Mollisiaceae sp. DMI_Dod_QoI]